MKVVMTDLKAQYESIKDEIGAAIKQVIKESDFILGKQVNLLEEELGRYLGVKFAVGVASGTDALVLSLVALGIGHGDEVITTPFTFIATVESISRVGAKPVFCDIDDLTYNIDANKIHEKITKRSKAILPVHLYGLPCDMGKIMAIAKEYQLNVIEDCAQSFGSEYNDRKVGVLGDCGCFSFFPAKTLGCYGDGGMAVTNDEKIASGLKMLGNHGSSEKYFYSRHGFNSRLDTLQAAILRVKLKYVDTWINKRIENAKIYNECLSGASGITVPVIPTHSKHSFNYYTIRLKQRERVQNQLKAKGMATAIYYPLCLHLQEIYKDLSYRTGDFPVAEKAQEEVLSLPIYPELSKEQIQEVCFSVKEALV